MPSPWAFVGGTIKRVAIDVSGEAFVDLVQEARAAFARRQSGRHGQAWVSDAAATGALSSA